VRAISKSGTNLFHGSGYEYFYDNQRFQSEATEVQPRRCNDDQLAGLTVNDASVSATPTGISGEWAFSIDIPLQRNTDTPVTIDAWAGYVELGKTLSTARA